AAFYKGVLYLRVHHQVYITHAVALLWVGKGIVYYAVFLFGQGQGSQGLAQYAELGYVYTCLTRLGFEYTAFYADDVAQRKLFFENLVVQEFVFARAKFVAVEIALYTAMSVLQHTERGLTHDAPYHQAAS